MKKFLIECKIFNLEIFSRISKINYWFVFRFKKFHSGGILDKYEKKNHMTQFLYKKFQETNDQSPVKFESTALILKKVALIYSISVLLLFFECLFKRLKINLSARLSGSITKALRKSAW